MPSNAQSPSRSGKQHEGVLETENRWRNRRTFYIRTESSQRILFQLHLLFPLLGGRLCGLRSEHVELASESGAISDGGALAAVHIKAQGQQQLPSRPAQWCQGILAHSWFLLSSRDSLLSFQGQGGSKYLNTDTPMKRIQGKCSFWFADGNCTLMHNRDQCFATSQDVDGLTEIIPKIYRKVDIKV